jgi:hypothetical protein
METGGVLAQHVFRGGRSIGGTARTERARSLLGASALGILLVILCMRSTADGKSVLPFVLDFWVPVLLYWVCRHLERSNQGPSAPVLYIAR